MSSTITPSDGRADFDFLVGRWRVHHRRLQKRLAGDTNWDDFEGTCEMRPIMGGLGNIEDNVLNLPAGTYRAAAIRQFDPATRRWSIWWMDARKPGIEPPVRGSFEDGVGTFLGEDEFEGRGILVRFVWSEITAHSARWEQAFSENGGTRWETNWVMTFERIA